MRQIIQRSYEEEKIPACLTVSINLQYASWEINGVVNRHLF